MGNIEDEDAVARITYTHQRLPKLFSKIKTESEIIHPFKYDCVSGKYLYPALEGNLRKNIVQGNGKSRATGFAIPVLGRLPKIFIGTYVL